jgi:deoxyguanosine kinase
MTGHHPYVTFEGPIAVGKTTLATLLANYLGFELVLEEFEGNDFLSDFYDNRDRWSLAMQLWFLAARREQLSRLSRPFTRPLVGDYSHWKDGIFARLLLRDRELRLFSRLDEALRNTVVSPDVIVYLDANNDVLLQRIRSRGRPYEVAIDGAYLDSLRSAYDNALRPGANQRYCGTTLHVSTSSATHKCTASIAQSCPQFPGVNRARHSYQTPHEGVSPGSLGGRFPHRQRRQLSGKFRDFQGLLLESGWV